MQDEKPGRNTQDRDRSREEQSRRPDAAGVRQGGQICAGDPRRNPLTLYGLCMQEYEALLVFPEELGCRDVLDGSCGGSRPIILGRDGLKRDGHWGCPSGPVVGASPSGVDVVYVFDACLWQVLHLERDLHSALDVFEGCGPAHPGVAALGKAYFHGLIFLGLCACRQGQRRGHKHRDHQGCSAKLSRSVHHPPSISSIGRQAVSQLVGIAEFVDGENEYFVLILMLRGRREVPGSASIVLEGNVVSLQLLDVLSGESIVAHQLVVALQGGLHRTVLYVSDLVKVRSFAQPIGSCLLGDVLRLTTLLGVGFSSPLGLCPSGW